MSPEITIVDAIYNLGIDTAALGRLDEAAAHYREALRLRPAHVGARHNLGTTLGRRSSTRSR